jgi:hypothetical protein
MVPLPCGRKVAISHKGVSHTEKTLGAMTSPDGDSSVSILMMWDKAQQWINNLRNGHLYRQNVWFSIKVQLWPRVGYGICSLMATLS